MIDSRASIKIIAGGEGSGKSMTAGEYLAIRTYYDLQWGRHLYWIVGADYEDARKDFDYFADFMEQLEGIAKLQRPSHKDQQCALITTTGHEIVTISSYDFTKIARDEPFGIIGAEVSRWFPETFFRCEEGYCVISPIPGVFLEAPRNRVKGGSLIRVSKVKGRTNGDLEVTLYPRGATPLSTREGGKTLPLSVLRLAVALKSLEKGSEPSSLPQED